MKFKWEIVNIFARLWKSAQFCHWAILGFPFLTKFNVPFYIVLCTIYLTFSVCHWSLHSRFNFFPFNIQLRFMHFPVFAFDFQLFHNQQSSFRIRPSSSVECTFIFSHPTFSICPLSFRFRHPTLGIVLASFRIRHSTFRIELLPAGQRPMEIVGSINLTHPREIVVESRSKDFPVEWTRETFSTSDKLDVDNR